MKNQKIALYFSLFSEFFKIGLFTFGGGYAMISMISQICVEKRKWISDDDMMNITVIAESTPGPMALNCATFVGFRQAGLTGSILATIALIIPSFIIICLIAVFFSHFMQIQWVANAFEGIKIAAALLVLDAGFSMLKKMPKKVFPLVIMSCSFGIMVLSYVFSLKISSVLLMIFAALISIVFHSIKSQKTKTDTTNGDSK